MRLHARLVAVMVLWTTAALAGPNDIKISQLGNPSQDASAPNYVPGANGSFRSRQQKIWQRQQRY